MVEHALVKPVLLQFDPLDPELIPQNLVQPFRGGFNFEVKDSVIVKYVESFNAQTSGSQINLAILYFLHKIFSFAKKTLKYPTKEEAESMKEKYFSCLFKVLSSTAADEDYVCLLSNRKHEYNPQKGIRGLADFDLRMKLFLDMHSGKFNNVEDLKCSIEETCMLIAEKKKIAIEAITVEITCGGGSSFELRKIEVVEKLYDNDKTPPLCESNTSVNSNHSPSVSSEGSTDDDSNLETDIYGGSLFEGSEWSPENPYSNDLNFSDLCSSDFDIDNLEFKPFNFIQLDKQPSEKQAVEEQRMDEHRMEEHRIEDDQPRWRRRINHIKVLRRMIREDDIGSIRSLVILLCVLIFHILVCYNWIKSLNELVMTDV